MKIILRAVSAIVALVLLYFAFRNISFLAVLEAIASSSPWLLLLGLVSGLSEFIVRAVRWRYLLSPMRLVGYYKLIRATLVGFAAGNITANAIGSFPRILPIVRDCGVDRDFALGTVAAEIALDVAAIALGAVLLSLFSPVSPTVRIAGIIFAVVLAVAIASLSLFFRRSATAKHFAESGRTVPGDVKGLRRVYLQALIFLRDIVTGMLLSLRDTGVLLRVLPLTALVWVLEATQFYFVALGLHLELTYLEAATVMISMHIVIGLPSVPGFIGTLDAAIAAASRLLGVPAALSNAYAVVIHFYFIVPSTLLGLFFWWREKVPLDITEMKKQLNY